MSVSSVSFSDPYARAQDAGQRILQEHGGERGSDAERAEVFRLKAMGQLTADEADYVDNYLAAGGQGSESSFGTIQDASASHDAVDLTKGQAASDGGSQGPAAQPAQQPVPAAYQKRLDDAVDQLVADDNVDFKAHHGNPKTVIHEEEDAVNKVADRLNLLCKQGTITGDEARYLAAAFSDRLESEKYAAHHHGTDTGFHHANIAPPNATERSRFTSDGGATYAAIDITPKTPTPDIRVTGNAWLDQSLEDLSKQWMAEPADRKTALSAVARTGGFDGDKYLVHIAADGTWSFHEFTGDDAREEKAADQADSVQVKLAAQYGAKPGSPQHDHCTSDGQQYLATLHADGRFTYEQVKDYKSQAKLDDAVDALGAQMQALPQDQRHDLSKTVDLGNGYKDKVTLHPDGSTDVKVVDKPGGGFFGFLGDVLPVLDVASLFVPVLAPIAAIANAVEGGEDPAEGNVLGGLSALTGSAGSLLGGVTTSAGRLLDNVSQGLGGLNAGISGIEGGNALGLIGRNWRN